MGCDTSYTVSLVRAPRLLRSASQIATAVAERLTTSMRTAPSIFRGSSDGGGNKNDDMDSVLPLLYTATMNAAHTVKPANLLCTSLEYIVCVVSLVSAVSYFLFYRIMCVGIAHYEVLKKNYHPPWFLYRWLGSKGVDVTDRQWYYFVVIIPSVMPYLILFLYVSHRLRTRGASNTAKIPEDPLSSVTLIDGKECIISTVNTSCTDSSTDEVRDIKWTAKNVFPLHVFHIISGMIIALGLCGPGFFFGVFWMLLNFYLIVPLHKKLSFRVCMTVMWVTHVVVLFVNFYAGGYRFAWLGLGFLDKLWTPIIPWSTQYNMSVLRMISFNSDFWESESVGEEQRQKSLTKHACSCITCAETRERHRYSSTTLPQEALSCYRCRTECPRYPQEYTISSYLGYIFYLPLFMAGPLSSFNAYASYQQYPALSVSNRGVLWYGIRFACRAIGLITLMHYLPIIAILQSPAPPIANATAGMTPVNYASAAANKTVGADLATPLYSTAIISRQNMTSTTNSTTVAVAALSVLQQMGITDKASLFLLTLGFLWAKFDIMWRFFRLFALLDHFDPPEDMPRFFANTVSIQRFWRDWHASFNLWIVRYMYIPMGGSRTKFISIFPIFFFIAIWHDIELRLVLWALLICVGFVPEIAVKLFFSSNKIPLVARIKRRPLLWRYLRVFGVQLAMMELIIANLVGFSVGTTGTLSVIRELLHEMTWTFLILVPYLFLCAANLALRDHDREIEEQQQMKLKYCP